MVKSAAHQRRVSKKALMGKEARKRPPNSWLIYRSEKLAEHGHRGPNRPRKRQADLSRTIAEEWRNESDSVRKIYSAKAAAQRLQHFHDQSSLQHAETEDARDLEFPYIAGLRHWQSHTDVATVEQAKSEVQSTSISDYLPVMIYPSLDAELAPEHCAPLGSSPGLSNVAASSSPHRLHPEGALPLECQPFEQQLADTISSHRLQVANDDGSYGNDHAGISPSSSHEDFPIAPSYLDVVPTPFHQQSEFEYSGPQLGLSPHFGRGAVFEYQYLGTRDPIFSNSAFVTAPHRPSLYDVHFTWYPGMASRV